MNSAGLPGTCSAPVKQKGSESCPFVFKHFNFKNSFLPGKIIANTLAAPVLPDFFVFLKNEFPFKAY
jgi:hypothetical protein